MVGVLSAYNSLLASGLTGAEATDPTTRTVLGSAADSSSWDSLTTTTNGLGSLEWPEPQKREEVDLTLANTFRYANLSTNGSPPLVRSNPQEGKVIDLASSPTLPARRSHLPFTAASLSSLPTPCSSAGAGAIYQVKRIISCKTMVINRKEGLTLRDANSHAIEHLIDVMALAGQMWEDVEGEARKQYWRDLRTNGKEAMSSQRLIRPGGAIRVCVERKGRRRRRRKRKEKEEVL